jgi:DnaA family protein
MTLSSEVADYVLRRYPRDTHALFALLDQIDEASLTAQRRITIPFLQELDPR